MTRTELWETFKQAASAIGIALKASPANAKVPKEELTPAAIGFAHALSRQIEALIDSRPIYHWGPEYVETFTKTAIAVGASMKTDPRNAGMQDDELARDAVSFADYLTGQIEDGVAVLHYIHECQCPECRADREFLGEWESDPAAEDPAWEIELRR